MHCEHCKQPIPPGVQYTKYGGRYWQTDHLLAYQAARREGRKA